MLDLTLRFVFCALLGSVYASCPPRCECSEAAHTVKCVAKDLRSVPTGIPGYTRNLFITGNQISRIGPESFKGLENVTNLSLSNNRISEVESHTFSGLRSLRSLDLSNNQLAVIHPEAFTVQNQTLRELNLSRALYNHTSVMDLATSLRWSSLGSLQGLDLSDNSLIFLPSRIFSHLLDLTLNALRTLTEEGLEELDSLPSTALLLGENPFTCTCGIEPFALWLNRSQGADLALQTSYVFLGIVLGFIGLIFLFVLYLNRKGIKKRIYDMRDACREVWEGYHYRFEIDSDPRLSQVSTSAEA
uniref:LRRNT domain-containing protein n=1 Tax=Anabas testudineus TaxID=64144 RepID=A0AAQ6IEL2_ANATE